MKFGRFSIEFQSETVPKSVERKMKTTKKVMLCMKINRKNEKIDSIQSKIKINTQSIQ